MMEIYSELVQNGVFTYFYTGMDMSYSLKYEVWNHCPYHNATNHNIKKFLEFRHDLESLINMEKFQVEFVPGG